MVVGKENQTGDRRLAGAGGLWQGFRVMSASAAMVEPPRIPAPPELVARAEALVREYDVKCFWFWHPDAKVKYIDDIELVIHHLREYGDHEAWKAAQELRKCL